MAPVSSPLDLAVVRSLFGAPDVTRVHLAWDRLAGAGVTADLVSHDGQVPGDWFTPWYVDGAGMRTDFDSCDARPVRVRDAAQYAAQDPVRLAAVLALAAQLTGAGSPPHLMALTWALPNFGAVVLDGNHRLVAAAVSRRRVHLAEFRLSGPTSPALAADLRHHCG